MTLIMWKFGVFLLSQIKLDFPNEYVIQVKGTMGTILDENIITSLTFITNKQNYGPYGSECGRKFQSSNMSGSIVGFYGRASLTSLDQIGCIKKIPSQNLSKTLNESNRHIHHICAIHYDHSTSVIPQGPWGGWGGQEFYDGRGDIIDLNINFTDTLITSIQVGYEQGGIGFQGRLHGGKGVQQVKVRKELGLNSNISFR